MTTNDPESSPGADATERKGTDASADDVIAVRRGMFGASGTGDTSGYGRLVRPVGLPGGTAPPYGGDFDDIVDALRAALPTDNDFDGAVESIVVFRDELTLHIHRSHLRAVAQTLRDDPTLRFELCLGVSGVHYPDDTTGRELRAVYQLMSITHNRRLCLEVSAPEADPHIPSLYQVYPTTDWHEREAYDFFGILFDDHPALTRILMPDDWVGHPQRKDYPLGGIPVEYKGARIPPPNERRAYS